MHDPPRPCVIPGCYTAATLAYQALVDGQQRKVTRPDGRPIHSCNGHAMAVINRIAGMLGETCTGVRAVAFRKPRAAASSAPRGRPRRR